MLNFHQTLPAALQKILEEAKAITAIDNQCVLQSIKNMDITSLKSGDIHMYGDENEEEIRDLCNKAQSYKGAHPAAICVYPNQIASVKKYLQNKDIRIAVVNNFPHGEDSADDAADAALEAIEAGANEIDTVIDYEAFINGDVEAVEEKLDAVSEVCQEHGVKLKIILKASVYESYDELYQAARLAINCGADFVKTCTGKTPKKGFGNGQADASTLFTAATIMQAVADAGISGVGVKISGGVKTPEDCMKMKFLSDSILGAKYFASPELFRFGASSLMDNLVNHLEGKTPEKPKSGY